MKEVFEIFPKIIINKSNNFIYVLHIHNLNSICYSKKDCCVSEQQYFDIRKKDYETWEIKKEEFFKNHPEFIEYTAHIPKENVGYIYRLDIAWNNHGKASVPENIIVYPRYNKENNNYEFEYEGQTYNCHYNWAFVENTEDNKTLLYIYNELQHKIAKLQKESQRILKRITLGKKE